MKSYSRWCIGYILLGLHLRHGLIVGIDLLLQPTVLFFQLSGLFFAAANPGLVLLEAIMNDTPWASTPVAGAEVLQEHGFIYNTLPELMEYIEKGDFILGDKEFVRENHMIDTPVKQILGAIT